MGKQICESNPTAESSRVCPNFIMHEDNSDKVKYLEEQIGFPPDLADLAARGNVADELFQLASKNFKISEGDPLIVLQ